jgi:hypothetical protein
MYDTLLKRFTELKSSFKEERETFFALLNKVPGTT